jgi:hypothetical protein
MKIPIMKPGPPTERSLQIVYWAKKSPSQEENVTHVVIMDRNSIVRSAWTYVLALSRTGNVIWGMPEKDSMGRVKQ